MCDIIAYRKCVIIMGAQEKRRFFRIPEAYEELKKKYCPKCKHFKKDEYCLYFAMCFVNFFLKENTPQYFSPKEFSE